jgi:hypothetical protein
MLVALALPVLLACAHAASFTFKYNTNWSVHVSSLASLVPQYQPWRPIM